MALAQLGLHVRSAVLVNCMFLLLSMNAAGLQVPETPPASVMESSAQNASERPAKGPSEPGKATLVQKAWKILASGVADEKKEKRATAVRVLGLLPRNARAQQLAETALQDKEPEVRAAAAQALGQMNARSSRARLRKALEDKDSEVILAAANALRGMRDESGYRVYYAVLSGNMKTGRGLLKEQQDTLKDPKKMAMFGFEQGIGQIPFAGVGYHAFKALTKDDASPIRAAAAKAISQDPDPDAGKVLVQAATGDKSWVVRTAALDAIAHRDDPSLAAKIALSLGDEREEARFTAAAAIVRLSEPRHSKKKK